MQLSFKSGSVRTLGDLACGESGILESLDLDAGEARRMMELGFIPGVSVCAARCAPGGDPRVYQVDGSEVAMRRETAVRLLLRPALT